MANLSQIETYLKKQKIPFKVIDLGRKVYTVEGVKATGINANDIVKTLVVRVGVKRQRQSLKLTQQGLSSFIVLVLKGEDRVDFGKCRKMFGNKCELAKQQEVLKVTGVPVGAVCPVLLDIPIYIDMKVMDLANVNMGSGNLKKGLGMKLSDLLNSLIDYQVIDVSSSV